MFRTISHKKVVCSAARRFFVTGEEFAKAHASPRRPINILFFGSSDVAIPTLVELNKARQPGYAGNAEPLVDRLEVVVPPLKTRGKKLELKASDVETAAIDLGLPIHRLATGTKFRMQGFQLPPGPFDLGIVISFGYMLRPEVIDTFPMGMINAHASLLPALRGAAPIQYALLRGLSETGVTVTTLHPTTIDAGRVLHSAPIPIPPRATFATLAPAVAACAADSVLHVLRNWDDIALHSLEQSQLPGADSVPAELRNAPKITKADGVVHWASMSAREVAGRWQGLTGFTPVFCTFAGKRMELLDVEEDASATDSEDMQPGEFLFDAARAALVVQCRSGRVLVRRLQLECKKACSARDFANGHLLKRGLTRDHFQ